MVSTIFFDVRIPSKIQKFLPNVFLKQDVRFRILVKIILLRSSMPTWAEKYRSKHSIYIRTVSSEHLLSALLDQFLVGFLYCPFEPSNMHHASYHGLRTPREENAFTARPKIHSHSQIFSYGLSIFCLPLRPNFSDTFDLRFHWVSVVRVHCQKRLALPRHIKVWVSFALFGVLYTYISALLIKLKEFPCFCRVLFPFNNVHSYITSKLEKSVYLKVKSTFLLKMSQIKKL